MEMVREKIARILQTHNIEPGEIYHGADWERHRLWLADQILKLLHEAGYRLMSPDQTLPLNPYATKTRNHPNGIALNVPAVNWEHAQLDMVGAGYRKVSDA